MSLTTLTIGGESYISYATLSEANIALVVDPVRSTAWQALADEAKEHSPRIRDTAAGHPELGWAAYRGGSRLRLATFWSYLRGRRWGRG